MNTLDRRDLVRRVRLALDLAGPALDAATRDEAAGEPRGPRAVAVSPAPTADVQPLHLAKVAAEAAMLARCAAGVDEGLAANVDALARRVGPLVRGTSTVAAMCREPAAALVHATGHVLLRDLGHGDPAMDGLLAEIVGGADVGGPERTPTLELEVDWLRRIWAGGGDAEDHAAAHHLRSSCVGRPLDVLGSSTRDLYSFTHVVLYATDMGRRTVEPPRGVAATVADAEAGLAAAIDADNLDLAAELLWTWPMLGVPFSPAAAFSFGILASAQDEAGFVPGPGFDAMWAETLVPDERERYVLRTSYHATFVTGFLCAAGLRRGGRVTAPRRRIAVSGLDAVLPLLGDRSRDWRWREALRGLDRDARGPLAPFLLAMGLRRASTDGDLALVRRFLEVAVECGLTDGPAVRQAVALLRRMTALGRMTGRTSAGAGATATQASVRPTVQRGRRCQSASPRQTV